VERERAALRAELDRFRAERAALAALDPRPGEDDELRGRIAAEEHRAALLEAFRDGIDRLYEGDGAAYDALARLRKVIGTLTDPPAELAAIDAEAGQCADLLAGLAARMRGWGEAAESGNSLADMQARYYALQEARHSFGRDLAELAAYRGELEGRIRDRELQVEHTDALRQEVDAAWAAVCERGRELDQARRKAAPRFERRLLKETAGLDMPACRFTCGVETAALTPAGAGPTGFNRVDFRFSANPGVEPRPLGAIASGGEISRIMLAIQTIAGGTDCRRVLVFDEIDSEIGGRLGAAIGRKMRAIARDRQVLCITHLPQLACFGDRHFRIAKAVRGGQTRVTLEELAGEGRLEELAAMLRGDAAGTANTYAEVKHMLEQAGHDR
jgi:DNA repair protein RecN (Recombination protein N)